MSKPIVAIVGRPNVGKSTLFNVLAGETISIVKDTPGVTRDRIYADCNWLNMNFTLVDTGGIEPDSRDIILSQMRGQYAKFGGAEVFIKPASHGTGVVAGGAMRAVLESVGVTDVLAKSKGSSNPHNLVKATILALSEMRDARMVAQNRGVSMEKVFRG